VSEASPTSLEMIDFQKFINRAVAREGAQYNAFSPKANNFRAKCLIGKRYSASHTSRLTNY
jgi:hypothetical protein